MDLSAQWWVLCLYTLIYRLQIFRIMGRRSLYISPKYNFQTVDDYRVLQQSVLNFPH